jgi:hypothetical protein
MAILAGTLFVWRRQEPIGLSGDVRPFARGGRGRRPIRWHEVNAGIRISATRDRAAISRCFSRLSGGLFAPFYSCAEPKPRAL